MNCYAVIKSWGLSAEQEIEFLSIPGNTMDRVRFSGNFLHFDITQSELMENLVDIHFEENGKIFDIIRNKIVRQDDPENLVIKYYKENSMDYIDGIL